MANTLKRNLKAGDKLIMENGAPATVAEPLLFGAFAFTAGSALMVNYQGQLIKTTGFEIDAEATNAQFGKVNGWTK